MLKETFVLLCGLKRSDWSEAYGAMGDFLRFFEECLQIDEVYFHDFFSDKALDIIITEIYKRKNEESTTI